MICVPIVYLTFLGVASLMGAGKALEQNKAGEFVLQVLFAALSAASVFIIYKVI